MVSRGADALRLHVLLPGLLDNVASWQAMGIEFPRLPGLENLLGRAVDGKTGAAGYDATVCSLFGIVQGSDADLPLGALRRYGYTPEVGSQTVMCIDPVYLRADIRQLFLHDPTALDISETQAAELAGLIDSHLDGSGRRLERSSPHHWHLVLERPAAIQTAPLREVVGRDIDPWLPWGEQAMAWRGLLNEMQMLLHDCAANGLRSGSGQLPVNSVWFYGQGTLPMGLQTDVSTVWTKDAVTTGLAKLAEADVHDTPTSIESVLQAGTGCHLVCIEDLQFAADDRFSDWMDMLCQLEARFFAPLADALRRQDVQELHLYDCRGRTFSIKGWRRFLLRKPVRSLASCVG